MTRETRVQYGVDVPWDVSDVWWIKMMPVFFSHMKSLRRGPICVLSLLLFFTLSVATPLRAGLVINATAGDISAPPTLVGGGDITTIFNQAASYWEMAFPDPGQDWTLNLTYQWAPLGTDQVARFTTLEVAGDPARIRNGLIAFNNVSTTEFTWFADPNPELMMNNPAFTAAPVVTNQDYSGSGGMVELNTGIVFVSGTGSPAFEKMDLLTIAMHEIGHGLGLLNNPSPPFDPPNWTVPDPIQVTSSVSAFYAGVIIEDSGVEHLFAPSLMASSANPGSRYFASSRDMLAMATISQYDNPSLNPYHVPGVPVPEPSSAVLCLVGLALLGRRPKA